MARYTTFLSSILFALFLFSCSYELNYETMVRQGLQSGVQQDSLFLGYHFGMNIQEFHSSSMEMNRQGKLSGFTKAVYKLEALKSTASMEFYPTFVDGIIVRIPVTIGYDSWAPWNEQFSPDELTADLIEYYEDVYNTQFIQIYVPEIGDSAYVSIEGNREIRIYQNSLSTVMVDFIDLSVYRTSQS